MENFKNRSLGVLTSGIDITATECILETGHGNKFPAPPFFAQIYRSDYGSPAFAVDDNEAEWILVTNKVNDTLTIERGKRGDSVKNLNTAGKTYYLVAGPSAETFDEIRTKLGAAEFNWIEFGDVWGAGVSICPEELLPVDVVPMAGCYDRSYGNANYGNYKCVVDNSQMVYICACAFKLTGNEIDIQPMKKWDYNLDAAAADGYAVFRDFIQGGKLIKGKFYDKVDWSLTNFEHNVSGIASSIIGGNPISSNSATNRDAENNYAGSFSNCKSNNKSPADYYYGIIEAAKSRGNDFYPVFMQGWKMVSFFSLCQSQKTTSTTFCSWYDPAGVINFPKGNNNYGADYDDPSVTFDACDDGFWSAQNEARKTGGANDIAKTTHNGQNCGIADIQGNQYKIALGLTCDANSKNITGITRATEAVFTIELHNYSNGQVVFIEGSDEAEWESLLQYQFAEVEVVDVNSIKLKLLTNGVDNGNYIDTSGLSADYDGSGFSATTGIFYVLKESAEMKAITGGTSLSTDHWGASGLAENFIEVDLSSILVNKYASDRFGSGTNTVFAMNTDRDSNDYLLTVLGLPKDGDAISSAGTNQLGKDRFYKWIRNQLCPLVGGYWNYAYSAGAWIVALYNYRTTSGRNSSGRSCLNVTDV